MMTRCTVALAILLALSGLSACGKKGLLEAPEGSTYPQPYPRP